MPRRYLLPLVVVALMYFAALAGGWLALRDRSGGLLVTPGTRYAGESLAVDYEAVRGFVPGKPVLRCRP